MEMKKSERAVVASEVVDGKPEKSVGVEIPNELQMDKKVEREDDER